jgi:hypothetical protein
MPSEHNDGAASITSWLVRWRQGEEEALPQLTTLVYAELHRMAAVFFRQEREGHTLQPTALVHELYLNLPDVRAIDWKCRAQFFCLAARMMRNILVDHARKRNTDKRGAGSIVPFEDQSEGLSYAPDIVAQKGGWERGGTAHQSPLSPADFALVPGWPAAAPRCGAAAAGPAIEDLYPSGERRQAGAYVE